MDIEKLATSAVITAISRTDHIKAFISDEDKEPCWDGNIYLYERKNYSKDNIKRVPTQVKGKTTKARIIKNTITYSIENEDLHAYMMNGGTLFFVVYIDEATGDSLQIYYNALLPIKIQKILEKKTKKTHSVRMKKYPIDTGEQEIIISSFYDNAKMQASFAGMKPPSIDELSKNGALESISFNVISKGFSTQNPNTFPMVLPKYLENQSLTVYANIKGGVAPIPLEYYDNIGSVTTFLTKNESVGVGSKEYYSSYKMLANANHLKYYLGTCVVAEMPNVSLTTKESSLVKTRIQLRIKGTLSERINGIEFILSMMDNRSFYIGKSTLEAGKIIKKKEINELKHYLDNYKKLDSFLDTLHVEEDLDLDNWKEEDYENLNLIITAIGKKRPIKNKPDECPAVELIRISNLNIAVLCIELDNNYFMFDYFNEDYWIFNAENNARIARFSGLTEDIMQEASNLNLNAIVKDFRGLEKTEENCYNGNEVLLELIKLYDAKPNEKIIDAISEMLEWLDSQPAFLDKDISIINRLQVAKRTRELSFSEKELLYEMIKNTNNIEHKIEALLLLDEQHEAEKYLNMLEPDDNDWIRTLPIFRFYGNS